MNTRNTGGVSQGCEGCFWISAADAMTRLRRAEDEGGGLPAWMDASGCAYAGVRGSVILAIIRGNSDMREF